jgi:hypothetical protein
MSPRRLLVTLPLALAVAAAAHGIRFGDEHAFGEEYHDWLCTLLLTGLPALAWAFLARALAALPTYGDGTILAERLAELVPGRGRPLAFAPLLAAAASAIYVGVERLEADGDTNYVVALVAIAVLSTCVAVAARRVLAFVASATLVLFRCAQTARAATRAFTVRPSRPRATPRRERSSVRLGRAPPLPA